MPIIHLGSARHRAEATLTLQDNHYVLVVSSDTAERLSAELARSFPAIPRAGETFIAANLDELAHLLRRAAALAQALPDQTGIDFES